MLGGWFGGEYKALADKKWKFVVECLNQPDWKDCNFQEAGSEGVKMFERPSATGFDMVKVTGTVPVSLEVIKGLLNSNDAEVIKNWDPDILKAAEQAKMSDADNIIFSTYWLPYPIYHRTFLTLKSRRNEPEGYVVLYSSINSKDVLHDPAFVRGVVVASAYIIKAVEGKNECQVTRFINVDPKGAIPALAVNASKSKMARGLVALRNYVKTKFPNGV